MCLSSPSWTVLGGMPIDVQATVKRLEAAGIGVHCLALGGADLTSRAGKMTMQVIKAVAEFERDLLIERSQARISRAKGERQGVRQTVSPDCRNSVRWWWNACRLALLLPRSPET